MTATVPLYRVNDEIINLVAEISELIGIASAGAGPTPDPQQRRERRIQSIYSSLAIDQSDLTLDQVTAIVNGRRIPEFSGDIREIKNANEAYRRMSELDPTSLDDLMTVNRMLMQDLSPEAGCLRSGNANVFRKDPMIRPWIPEDDVTEMIRQLFDWLHTTHVHPLIRGCIFQYAFECIHPFPDGNGRTGRLWHAMILQQWRPILAWLPMKNMLHEHQEEYYQALNSAYAQGECTDFILFMLPALRDMLKKLQEYQRNHGETRSGGTGGSRPGGNAGRNPDRNARGYEDLILAALKKRPSQTAWEMAEVSGLTPRITEKILKSLKKQGRLIYHDEPGKAYWEVTDQNMKQGE